ncbi:hypothetical protein DRQ36_09520 [bacterium]|nr:MAG: hypothetical protein DRQ36_09520 [bacterium]
MAKREHDPVYLVILALGIGLGFSAGTASEHIVIGLIGGAIVGLIGCLVYYFIKRSRSPKPPKTAKDKYRMN